MNPDSKSCLITGGAGFLGSAVASALVSEGYRIYGIDVRRPRNAELWTSFFLGRLEQVDFEALLRDDPPSIICHLAGSASVVSSLQSPFEDFESLIPGTARLLAWNGTHGHRARVLLFSSAAVYGNPDCLPISENQIIQPLSPYGIHKAAAERLVEGYSRLYDFESVTLRIFSAYGPGLRKQVIWDIATKAMRAHREKAGAITLHGTGRETRDFVYVDDIAAAVLILAGSPLPQGQLVVNMASGKETAISSLAAQVLSALDLDVKVVFSERPRPGDPNRWCGDIQVLRSLGWVPTTSIENGLRSVANWLRLEELG